MTITEFFEYLQEHAATRALGDGLAVIFTARTVRTVVPATVRVAGPERVRAPG